MQVRRVLGSVGAAVAVSAALWQTGVSIPSASADPCPDIEVIFARGTGAEPGLGWVGDAFVNALRPKVGEQSVGTYAVNYPAGFDFDKSAPMGAADASGRVQWMADNCPDTKLVLGGMSQGAGVIDLITVDPRPLGRFTPTPMPPRVADHVAAVVVFGNPLRDIRGGGPLPQMSGTYGAEVDRSVCARRSVLLARLQPAGPLRLRRQRHGGGSSELRRRPRPVAGGSALSSKRSSGLPDAIAGYPCPAERPVHTITKWCRNNEKLPRKCAWSCRGARTLI